MSNLTTHESTPLLGQSAPESGYYPHLEPTHLEHNMGTNSEDPYTNNSEATNANANANPTPLPMRTLLIIMLIRAMSPLAFEIIFPFINQMIFELGIVDKPEEVGFYSGLVESIFSCTSLITVMPISYLADYVGRKPIILWGTLTMAISTASFGTSKTLLAMIISRCIGGATGSVWVATKTVIAECTDQSNQGKAFQYLTIAYRIGQILGLPLGGLLSHPERHFALFQSKFWIQNPFALPCFVAAVVAVFSVILAYFLLDETLKPNKTFLGSEDSSLESSANVDHDKNKKPHLSKILTPPVVHLLVNNTIMCFVSEILFSLFPLFSFTPIGSGGLGQSEALIGLQMSARAIIHVGLMFLYSAIERRFFAGSTIRLYRFIMCAALPAAVCCMPGLNILARLFGSNSLLQSFALQLVMCVFFVIWGFAGFAWTSMTILVTDASPSEQALSIINGISQMAIILPQALAPAAATSLFALSIKTQFLGGHLIWVILLIIACGGALHSLTLQEPISNWRMRRGAGGGN